MHPVLLLGVERPALAALLAERGLAVRTVLGSCAVALVAENGPRPACPAVVEATSSTAAGKLLDEGADDVVLPTDSDDLVAARLAALVRRGQPGTITFGDLSIDTVEHRVTHAGEALALLPREYRLLAYLARHAPVAVDHATLHQALWGSAFNPGTNVIAVHVSRLRARLVPTGVTVLTERGRGYRLALRIAGDVGTG